MRRRVLAAFALTAVAAGFAPAGVAVAAPAVPGQQADALELAYDGAGVVHLVAHITTNGEPNELFHYSQAPGGGWSAGENLTPGFGIAGPAMELLRAPDGRLCLLFDGWRTSTDLATVGLYRTCLRDGAWEPPTFIAGNVGVTATFDGAFLPNGDAVALSALPGRSIAYGSTELWALDPDPGWPRLAVDGSGTLHAAWAAFTDPFGIFTSRSTDGGATWTPNESLSGDARPDVPFELVTGADGDLHLLTPGNPVIYRRWDGQAWSAVEELELGIGPKRLAVGPDGLAVIAWASQDAVRLVRQLPGGGWAEPVLLEAVASPPSVVAVAIDDGGSIGVVWADADGIGGSTANVENFRSSVPSPFDISLDPLILAQSAAIAAGTILLVPLPAQLFNNTVETNYAEISSAIGRWRRRFGGWIGGLRRRAASGDAADGAADAREGVSGFWRRPIGIAAFFGLAAIISAFLDPSLSLTVESAATVLGLLAGLVFVAFGFALPGVVLHRVRSRGRARIDVLPLALPIAIVSVAISRLTGFEPGYLYGLLAGITLLGPGRPGDDARSTIVTSVWMLAVVGVAWFALVPVRELAGGGAPPLWGIAVEAALATIVVSGLETLLFGLLPLSIGPGGPLFRANRRAWAVLFGVAAFAFFHVLVNPTSGYLVDSASVPVLTTMFLLAAFGALTGLTWAYFRFRPRPAAGPPSSPA